MIQHTVQIPIEYKRLFDTDWREAAVYGGRNSLKSHTVARTLLIRARQKKTRVACFREFQNSIADSSHQLLADLIKKYELNEFKVTDKTIENTINGSDFIFKGLHHNEQSVKSIEGIDIAWVEEAQTVSQKSLEVLTPTVRKPGSQIVYTYNRLLEDDPVHQRLVIEGRPNTLIINCNYDIALKYGWMPEELRREMEDDKEKRPNLYKHKWLGEPSGVERKIFRDWEIIDEIPHEAQLIRYGLDFGYSCLVGETKIATIEGEKRIDEIQKGDLVLTRNGYKKVADSWSNGIKCVYSVDFGNGRRIIATGDHRVYTTNGWTRVDELPLKATICEKKLSLKEKFMCDIQTESTKIISLEKKETSHCGYIGKSTKAFMVAFQKVIMSTILMVTHLITQAIILLQLVYRTISKNTITILNQVLQVSAKREWKKYTGDSDLEKTTGKQEEQSQSRLQKNVSRGVLSAMKTLYRQTHTKNIADQFVEKKQTRETKQKSIYARIADKVLSHRHTTQETHVLRNVQVISQLLKEKREVFDLTVEGEHEFFANGVLVHNCDPTALIAIYKYNDGFILDECLYQKGLSNKQIADFIKSLPQCLVKADSAEPKSIDEISQYGIMILPATKGQGSVEQGIQFVQAQRISVTRRSHNLLEEYHRYLWEVDKNDNIINKPIDMWNHAMDAIRYGFTQYQQPKPKPQVTMPQLNTYQ